MDDTWQIGGLPLHPLLVHAAVVLVPLAVAAVVLAQFWPAARRRLGAVTPLAAIAVAVVVPLTLLAGLQLKEVVGPLPRVLRHEGYGRALLPWTLALAALAVVQWWWFRVERTPDRRAVRIVLAVATVVIGAGTIVAVVLAGDSGARAVWEGVLN